MRRVLLMLSVVPTVALLMAGAPSVGAKFCPDYDHDGVVTVADAQAVAERFGTYPGGPPNSGSGLKYSGKYDLNKDQAISIGDVLLVGDACGDGAHQEPE